MVKTIYPDDVVTRKEYDWAYNNNSGDNPPNLSDEGQPSNFTDYQVITSNAHAAQFYVKMTVDNLSGARYSFIDFYGREIRKAYPAHSGNTIYEDRSFLPSGSLGISPAPYFKGDIPVKTTHIYDSFDRFTLSIPTVGPAYLKTYDVSITPAYLKTTTKNLGTSKEKVVFSDPGGTYLVQEEGTEIDYILNSSGQPDEIIVNNNPQLTTQFTYDALGRKLSVTEPNKGTTTFTYNDLDQITSETLPSGLTFGYFYNDLGAIISKSSSAANYAFTYYPSSSAAAGKIKKKTLNTGNLTSIEFEYDAVGRLSKSTESTDATHTFVTEYSYNNFGQIATRKYPSNILIQYNYNSNGFLSGLKTSAQKLWEISNMNHLGQITQAFYFDNANQNGYSSWRSYDELGLPTERIMYSLAGPVHTTISWNQYSFDQSSGNLLWRENKLNNLREEFTYDPLYRLTNVSSNTSVPAMQLSYGPEGNILKKSDVTSSSYDWRYEVYGLKTVPDDIGGVTELSGVHQLNTQIVDYFSHNNRVKELKEAGNEVHFTYGPDQQRVKMELNPGLPGEKIRYYANDYEETTENGITTKLTYIRAAGELIAIIRESQGVSSIYYVESDYLGSITHILDAQGGANNGIVEERSFDSWGRPRNPLNWQYYPSSVHSPDWLTDRGFTGHEHIWVNG